MASLLKAFEFRDLFGERGTVPNSLYQPVASDSGTGFDCHIFLRKRHVSTAHRMEKPPFLAYLLLICFSGFVPAVSIEGERRVPVEINVEKDFAVMVN